MLTRDELALLEELAAQNGLGLGEELRRLIGEAALRRGRLDHDLLRRHLESKKEAPDGR